MSANVGEDTIIRDLPRIHDSDAISRDRSSICSIEQVFDSKLLKYNIQLLHAKWRDTRTSFAHRSAENHLECSIESCAVVGSGHVEQRQVLASMKTHTPNPTFDARRNP